MHIDHVCIAVRSIDNAATKLCQLLGYLPKTRKVANSRHKVNVQFLGREGSLDIKLIEPCGEDSPLWQFLRKGEGLHHLCFMTSDTATALADLQSRGLRVLTAPTPGEAFNGGLIAFGYAGFGLNIELIDTTERRDRVDCTLPERDQNSGDPP
ncbi:MAG TPA: VOC family protein [Candidatus Methanoperedens sp.]|nr:VOC family protein [Candidatus Methanoperedens sp.]